MIQDAGKFGGSVVDFLRLRLKGSWRMGEILHDFVPRNIGLAGLIFEPALLPLLTMLLAIGGYMIGREIEMHGAHAYED